ncbi:MAG TPA: ABC transporter permease [Thermoanaerobaculia bacterium]|nr:ABC transporter permease [Thermoanaerobaculia bacterium]
MRLYRLLLHLYPASFRGEYGEEMCRVLALRRSRLGSGLPLFLALVTACAEILPNAFALHLSLLRQDLHHLARSLRQSPSFALTAIPVIALGIGATTAAFSIADFVLLRPLPFPQAERLVRVWESLPGYARLEPSPANFRDWQRLSRSLGQMGALQSVSLNLVGGPGGPERLEGSAVTSEVFPLLGVRPLLGRFFTAGDDRVGAPGTVVLSHALWQKSFGGDRTVLGRRVLLDGAPYLVIGVMPPDFSYPRRQAQLWIPRQLSEQDFEDRTNYCLEVVARLGRGVPLAQAQAEMAVIAAQLRRQYPAENKDTGANLLRLRDGLPEPSRLLLLALCGAALCVLLITCANLANLLLVRALARRPELAVRAALGAGRERLVRQLVTESLALAFAGGALGVLVAVAVLPLLTRLVPLSLPLAQAPAIDLPVLLFAGLLTTLTGIGFGTFPALRACRDAERGGLRQGERGGRRARLRSLLVTTEVAAAVVLLISAGLLLRALYRVQATDPGFRADGVLTLRTALPIPRYASTARRVDYYTRVLAAVRALPGVESAGFTSFLPLAMRGGIWPVSRDGEAEDRGAEHSASLRYVTPGFLPALGVSLHQGREISDSDTLDRPFVAVVSASFVRRFWPEGRPLGRHFFFAFHDRTVVGVVGDVRVRGFERPSEPQVYLPYRQVPDGMLIFNTPKDLVVLPSGNPESLLPAVRGIVRAIDPEQPISDVRTLADVVAEETAPRAVQARVLTAFAVLAALLAGIGIYGLLSFAVSQRAREIGVRLALGARTGEILALVLRQAAWLAAAGVIPGMLLAYAAGRAMGSLLAGLDPFDPQTFLTAAALCLLMTLAGSLRPALRAARVDPVEVLRKE